MFERALLDEIRRRFHHVDTCPYQGPRVFFENAGGSLTLKSVVETGAELAAIPDNQGRDNPASKALVELIQRGRQDMLAFIGASRGQVFVGESGTECIFRLLRTAILNAPEGIVLGSTLEHPATFSAARRWAQITGRRYVAVPHNPQTATVGVADYARYVTADTVVATIIQTSPVSGMAVDVPAIVACIRALSPACLIIVDGIQHAPHGHVEVDRYDIDAYVVSAYKVFSRHNYGIGWVSPRLSSLPHDKLEGTADDVWELGTRDTAAYATFSQVVHYLDWLGGQLVTTDNRRERLLAAGKAIGAQEKHLIEVMLNGVNGRPGLVDMPSVEVLGGAHNAARQGLVSLTVQGVASARVVDELNQRGIRTHVRKNDYFSANILQPLGLDSCVRVSLCHYNSTDEVAQFLQAMQEIIELG